MFAYMFIMYRPGHKVYRHKVIFARGLDEAMARADEWAYCNGYADFKLAKGGAQ